MSATCPNAAETRRLVAARLDDTISAPSARALKAHLAACPACAAEALRLDATLLFAPLGAARPHREEAAEGRRMAADVLSAIDVERTERRVAARHGSPRRVVLRAASVALLVGGLVGVIRFARRPGPAPVAAAVPPTPPAAPQPAPLVIEDLHNPGATVYQFAASSKKEPNVVFVVDRNADI